MRLTSSPKEHINKRTVTQGKQRWFRKPHEILNELDSTAKWHCNWTSVSCKHKSDRLWANQVIGIGQLSGSSQLSERSGGVSRQSADTLRLSRDFHTAQRLDCVISNSQTRLKSLLTALSESVPFDLTVWIERKLIIGNRQSPIRISVSNQWEASLVSQSISCLS